MAMARRTWSVATGLARDTLGENLTCPTPSKDCFPECGAKGSRLTVGVWGPGVCSPAVSAHVRARTLWQGRWGTVPKGVRGGEEGGGVPKGVQGGRGGVGVARAFGFADCLVFGLVSYVVFGCFCLPPERFRTVQGYSALKKA